MSQPIADPIYVDDLPEPVCRYPVIVTVTQTHVVWVEAEDQDAAFQRARYDTYELLDDQETLADFELRLRKPGDDFHSWDWDTIYDGEYLQPYRGRHFDAHVEVWEQQKREARWAAEAAACAEQGHPQARVVHGGARRYCPTLTCGYLEGGVS